jgi:hypothetical protein
MIRYYRSTSLVAVLAALALPLAVYAQTPAPTGAPAVDGPSIQLLAQSDDVLPNLYRYVLAKAIHPAGKPLQLSIESPPRWTAFWSFRGAVTDTDYLMVYGTPTEQDIGVYRFRFLASDGETTFSQPVELVVAADAGSPLTLTWLTPTENDDGSPLTDLAAYQIYLWPPDARPMIKSRLTGNKIVAGGLGPGLWKIAVSALNAKGGESALSPLLPVLVGAR